MKRGLILIILSMLLVITSVNAAVIITVDSPASGWFTSYDILLKITTNDNENVTFNTTKLVAQTALYTQAAQGNITLSITYLNEGNNTIQINATNATNIADQNVTTISSIMVDLTDPSSVINTANNQWTSDTTPNLNFTLSDNLDPNQINYVIYVNGSANGQAGTAVNDTSKKLALTALNIGTHTIIVEAVDESGRRENSTPLTINIDNVNPTIENLTYPSNNSNLTTKSITFDFNTSDNLDTTLNYTLYINGTLNSTGFTTGNNTATTLTLTMLNGDYTYIVGLVDDAGNSVNSSEYLFNIICAESWSCSDWSSCSSSTQTRSCSDSNACGTTTNRPAESQSCTIPRSSGGTIQKHSLGDSPKKVTLDKTDKVIFILDKRTHYAQIKKIYDDYIVIVVRSDPIEVNYILIKLRKSM